ncbi:MAG: DNA polymerase I [Candidatus Gastranaerophilales bacterium]
MENKKTLILIDGHALAFRQYYALERTNMSTSDGVTTWGVFGFFKAIFDLLKNPKLDAHSLAVTFDVSHKTFRTETFAEYKSNRKAMPDPMKTQMDLIYEGLRAFDIPIYTKEGFEADDVIGTLSKIACEAGYNVLILTGDQDAFQLVDKEGCVKVILPYKGELIEYNWDKIYEKMGVYPDQVIDYKSLRGDVSDCIPGIKGIGVKTACKLLEKFKTLETCLEKASEIPEKGVREKVENGHEQAKLSKFLATIKRDLEIDIDLEDSKIKLPEIEKAKNFLTQMQFHGFSKNLSTILGYFNKENSVIEIETTPKIVQPVTKKSNEPQLQLGFFEQETIAQAEASSVELSFEKELITNKNQLSDLINDLKTQKTFALKIISDVKNAISSEIYGVCIGIECDNQTSEDINNSAKIYYIPFSPSKFENSLDKNDVLNLLKPILEDFSIKKTGHNLKTEINILKSYNIKLDGIICDTMLASYIKNASRKQEIEVQALEHLNHTMQDFPPFTSKRKEQITFSNAPLDLIFSMICEQTYMILKLTRFWSSNLDEKEIKLLEAIDIPTLFVLSEMEYNGIFIDTKYLEELSKSLQNSVDKIKKRVIELAGVDFNLNSPSQVSDILFNKLNIGTKKKKGNKAQSTNATVLEELANEHEIARLILDYRKYKKLKSTYTDSLPELIEYDKDNRIHTSYNQTVAVTGRLSSSTPNLQNIPIRTEEGSKIRNAFVPQDNENGIILSADYSQIELRILAHISKDKQLIEAFKENIDIHTLTASKVFEVPVEEVTKAMRSKAKAVNFGIIYGQSRYGLAKALNITPTEAKDFIDKYFNTYPNIKLYMDSIVSKAEATGEVETYLGRKRYLINELNSSNAMIREFAKRAAINHPIQGSAADLMKMAMIKFSKMLEASNLKAKIIMQVHDEIVLELDKSDLENVSKMVKEAMELDQPLSVPLIIDVNWGKSWKE